MTDPVARELRFERRMTDAEAMMWNIEKDPWLSSNVGTVTILDRPVHFEALRLRIAHAVAEIPRMRERVAPTLGRLAPPTWEPDPEFRLDYHVRRVALAEPGSERDLFDLAGLLLEDPLDRTRPLWQFFVIDGLSGGRGALMNKLHHTITDGKGGIRLAEKYMELSRDAPLPPAVDLDALVEAAVAERAAEGGDGAPGSLGRSILTTAGHAARRALGIGRRAVGDVALTLADPGRLAEAGVNVAKTVRSARGQISVGEQSGGSALWKSRSRHRHFDALSIPFAPAKSASEALGGSLNDFFVAASVIGGVRYHEKMGSQAESFHVTFVVSTRQDGGAGGNSFTPSKVEVPAGSMDAATRFIAVRDAMAGRRSEIVGAGAMGVVAGVAGLLPTSVTTRVARSQAAKVDFATSNVRAAPFPLYMSGAEVIAPYPMGPVAGTAWNITLMSYNGALFMGIHVDPVSVTDPDLLRRCLEEGFDDLILAGGAA